MQKKKKLWENLRLLNPRNLEKEVDVYGYHFAWKSHLLLLAGALIGIGAIGFVFQLSAAHLAIVLGAMVCALPVLVVDMYRKMYEQKRFGDVTAYMEQMLYSFQKNGKVISSLKESLEIFDEGLMRHTLKDAIGHIEIGKARGTSGVLKEGLLMIEQIYDCPKIHMVHELLVSAEEYGGEVENSIMLVLEDIERWKKRGYRLQAEKKKSHMDNMISIVVATILCAVALYVLDAMKTLFSEGSTLDIFSIPVIQISSMVFLVFLLHVFVKSQKSLTDDWLTDRMLQDEDYIAKSYEKIMQYDEKKEQKKSLIMGIPVLAAMVICFWCGYYKVGVMCLILAVFFLLQHKAGYRLAKKDVTDEMYLALPQWLMEMALLLQNNNVQVSLVKSKEGAPVVLKAELDKLTERLQSEPGKLQSYTSFCRTFDLPEVQSCMKMLHAVSENGTGDVRAQIHHLLERVGEMQDMADGIRNEKTAFRMKMIFSYPVLAATMKLLLDLTVGMVVMFQLLGQMGGA